MRLPFIRLDSNRAGILTGCCAQYLTRRSARPVSFVAAVGLCGFMGLWLRPHSLPLSPRSPTTRQRVAAPPLRSPSETARWEAVHCLMEAWQRANRDDDALEGWDPRTTIQTKEWKWRAQVLATDRSRVLHRGWQAARRAVDLARTPHEIYRAIWSLMCIESDLGLHREELAHARVLVSLRPHGTDSLRALEVAAIASGLPSLAKQADGLAAALQRTASRRRAP